MAWPRTGASSWRAAQTSTTTSTRAGGHTKPTTAEKNLLYARLLEGSEPDHDDDESSCSQGTYFDPSLTPIGTERKQLGNIRRLFGYYPDGTSDNQLGARLTKNVMKDVLFLSLDISENSYSAQNGYFDIGVSVLDTRHIFRLVFHDRYTVEDAMAAVESYHFLVGPDEKVQHFPAGKFRFGVSACIGYRQLPNSIDDIVRGRDYALIVSNDHSAFNNFEHFGVDSRFFPLCTINVVDSYNMAMQATYGDLSSLMAKMCLPFTDMEHPGNAAHYNLRSLMSFVTLDANLKGLPVGSTLIRVIGFLARSPEAVTTPGGEEWLYKFTRCHTKAVVDRKKQAQKEHKYCLCRHSEANCFK